MYPEKVPYWQRGQLITAERLNKAVRMLNWLLDIAADNDSDQQDDGESGGDVKVLPPGGSIPSTPYYDNPPVDVIDAAGQPFLKLGAANVETVPPPVFALKTAIPGEVPGTPYYTNVTTDAVGNVESVTVSESPSIFRLWDGSVNGSISVCSGALIQDEFGEFHTFDANPFFLPVIPVSSTSACGSVEDATTGQPVTAVSMLGSMTGNSVPVKSLVAGDGVNIEPRGIAGATSDAAAAAGYIRVSLSALNYDPTTAFPPSDPSYSTHKPPLGGIRGISYASTADITAGTKYPRVDDGQIILFPGNVAYDSNKFALVKQGSFWVLTIPDTTCTPTVGTPLFAAD